MRQGKAVGIVLALVDIILIVFCIVRYVQSDRMAPRFLLEAADIVYVPGMDSGELVQGITANDNRDGDVTDRIVIEKITEKRDQHAAVVYYAVADSCGNVAKLSKLFSADYPEEAQEERTAAVSTENNSGEESGREQDSAEQTEGPENMQRNAEETEGVGYHPEEAEENAQGQETELTEENQEEENGAQPEGDTDGHNGDAGQQEAEPEPEGEPAQVNAGIPELELGNTEVTINAGTNPPWTDIITIMRDDKDDYATLYYNLHVSQYNRNRPGSYPVTVYVEDSDGNRSQEVPITIIVR